MLVLLTHGRRKVPVCGKDAATALWAAALADTVLRRGQETPLPTSKTGGIITARINDRSLSRFLLDIYAGEPNTVAEAIMALRKLDPARAAWLVRVLQTRPELTALARAVHAELTGDAHDFAGGAAG